MADLFVPEIMTELRKDIVRVPEVIMEASGIKIFGKLIRSIIFTTDIAIIRNTNANAVIAVYPFTPHPAITKSIIEAAGYPCVFRCRWWLDTRDAFGIYEPFCRSTRIIRRSLEWSNTSRDCP